MQQDALENYVQWALTLQGFVLDTHETAEIVLQFSRIEMIAKIVRDTPVPLDLDPAGVFRP